MVDAPRSRSFSSRSKQRGATVFVVVLAITLLTALGLFAAHSATLVDRAAGYQRLARQTQQMAEYGVLAGAAELGSGTAGAHIEQLHQTGHFCAANAGADLPCYRRTLADLSARTKELSNESMTKDQAGAVEDVLGNGQNQGQFVVEFTDPSNSVVVPGSNQGSGMPIKYTYVRVTATTFAQLHATAAGSACVDNVAALSGQQAMRAHVVVGPVVQ